MKISIEGDEFPLIKYNEEVIDLYTTTTTTKSQYTLYILNIFFKYFMIIIMFYKLSYNLNYHAQLSFSFYTQT